MLILRVSFSKFQIFFQVFESSEDDVKEILKRRLLSILIWLSVLSHTAHLWAGPQKAGTDRKHDRRGMIGRAAKDLCTTTGQDGAAPEMSS